MQCLESIHEKVKSTFSRHSKKGLPDKLPALPEPPQSTAPALRMRGIHKRFPGVHALSDVDLEIAAGEVVAIIGENGAGKSTFLYNKFALSLFLTRGMAGKL